MAMSNYLSMKYQLDWISTEHIKSTHSERNDFLFEIITFLVPQVFGSLMRTLQFATIVDRDGVNRSII